MSRGLGDVYKRQLVATANENAALLPFDQVQQHVRDLLHIGLPAYDEEADAHGELVFTRMALTSVLQRIPNQSDEALLVPAWMLLLTTQRQQEQGLAESVLLINALDGNYINRWA